jgi:SIR2-like domain
MADVRPVGAARDLFVFAGAGVSIAPPAGLPAFNAMRAEILTQLHLSDYVLRSEDRHDETPKTRIAGGLAPEPFMLALRENGVDIEAWLDQTLNGGQPNAVHHALAQLARAGAAVWTVNFDTLIERVPGTPVTALAWPENPVDGFTLYKPHGSLPGPLIVTARQVLKGIDREWKEALGRAVADRLVVFVGYSGRDIDLLPLWDDVLTLSRTVLWFDFLDDAERARREALLPTTIAARGMLEFAPSSEGSNPSSDFVDWLVRNHLVTLNREMVTLLGDLPQRPAFPPLGRPLGRAEAAVRGLLGDARGGRRVYRRMLLFERNRLRTVRDMTALAVNQGGPPTAHVLGVVARMPFLPRHVRAIAERKRLTVYSRVGEHRKVLAGTVRLDGSALSTLLILRAEALRITASLDDAAEMAAEAHRRAMAEEGADPVRVAHAAYQQAQALLWAERLTDCRRCLDDQLRPAAAIAAARWLAWADFIAGGLALRDGDTEHARRLYELSEARFRGEGLGDGIVSVQTARLTMCRQLGDADGFRQALEALTQSTRRATRHVTYYARGHRFTAEAVLIERAEFARTYSSMDEAKRLYAEVARSEFPLQAALGELGLGLIAVERSTARHPLTDALATAERIGARLVARHADAALTAAGGSRPDPVFFC